MKDKINSLFKSTFVKNVLIVATGAAAAQAIGLILSPIITRLYGPEAFGIMGTFTSLTRIIVPIAALTYPVAIVLPKSDANAKRLIKLSLYITAIVAIITTFLLLFFKDFVIDIFNLTEIASFIYLIPLVIIFAGLGQISQQWLIRTNQFAINAKTTFLQSFIINSSKVGIGLVYPFASVLVVLQTLSEALKAFLMFAFVRKSDYKSNNSTENNLSLKQLAKKHRDFPLYRAPEELFNTISQNLPILLLTSLFGPASAGFYSIGRTVLGLPSRLIGQAIGDVFYPRINEAAHSGENLTKLIKKATYSLAGIGIIPFGIVVLFGPGLFSFVFGAGWETAGEYARWISLLSFSTFINKPSVRSMPVLNAQRFHLIFTIFRFTVRIISLIIGFTVFKSDIVAVALFGITSFLTNLLLISITLRLSKTKKINNS